jgi:hypothetical protein
MHVLILIHLTLWFANVSIRYESFPAAFQHHTKHPVPQNQIEVSPAALSRAAWTLDSTKKGGVVRKTLWTLRLFGFLPFYCYPLVLNFSIDENKNFIASVEYFYSVMVCDSG